MLKNPFQEQEEVKTKERCKECKTFTARKDKNGVPICSRECGEKLRERLLTF